MKRRLFLALSAFACSFPLIAAQVPRPAPEFVIKFPDGQQKLLSQYRGKVLAVEFLLTTCPHCQDCSSLMNKMYAEYGAKGFQPIGIAFNPMSNMLVTDYVKDLGLKFPVGFSERDPVMEFLQHPAMERMLVPQLVFIDRKGVIRAQYSGDNPFFQDEEKNMRAQIESLLKESQGASKAPARKSQGKSASLRRPQSVQ